jgi:transglutaminase-like putative cysteine protease
VSHVYRHAGRFRVSAEAYFAGYGWQPFDTITLTVRR